MRHIKVVTAPAVAQSVYDLLGNLETRTAADIILQAPEANAANVNFGTSYAQPGFIIPGGSASLEVTSTKNTYVKGNGSDQVIIMVLR